MSGINKVILVGRLGKEPDVKYTQAGKPITNITLATSESWNDKNTGQKHEKLSGTVLSFLVVLLG